MRIYKEHVQYNDRTDKKLKGFFPHAQHLLPPTDRGEEEDLTACSDCSLRVQQRFHELSITGRAKNVNFRRLTAPEVCYNVIKGKRCAQRSDLHEVNNC